MFRGEVILETFEKLHYAYFPITAVTSLLICLHDGNSVEVGMVGNEGMLGIPTLICKKESGLQMTIVETGYVYRVNLNSLQNVLCRSGGRRSGILQKLISRYTQALILQISQFTACNRRHTLDQHLSSWLLLRFDRAHTRPLLITYESIACLLGVRSESITVTAKQFELAGIIKNNRGQIELTNRAGMENIACECYKIIKNESNCLAEDLNKLMFIGMKNYLH
ncbi:Crp/Fnr family transcriptional regulator [Nitrosomonas supralitoralis]|uniref:Crp/Fnr family transcriptional regulator n=1 Tax=Nitrosomonas supralitoralis TaxID=2116706 RepID=A0A2P7NSD2_9PROT|nr:helix-turn-helix domain-containing protein [Nitrosomonas supralitoralis]PSJ16383.1 Crp/Fnr family transcriptional regulator [Nitrosomonas supralitoralis]